MHTWTECCQSLSVLLLAPNQKGRQGQLLQQRGALLLQTVVRRKTVWVLGRCDWGAKSEKETGNAGQHGRGGGGGGGGEGGPGMLVVALDWAACSGAASIGSAAAVASQQVD